MSTLAGKGIEIRKEIGKVISYSNSYIPHILCTIRIYSLYLPKRLTTGKNKNAYCLQVPATKPIGKTFSMKLLLYFNKFDLLNM